MYDRDRDYNDPGPVPTEYVKLDKAITTTLWLQKRLSLLERIRSCKRVECLRSELTSELDRVDSVIDDIPQGSLSLTAENNRLKSELDEAKEKILWLREAADNPGLSIKDTSGSGFPRLKVLFWVVIIVLIMIAITSSLS